MLILTATTDNLQAVLAGNVTTSQLQCVACWRDITTTAYTPGRTLATTNNTTDVNIVPAPASSTQRVVDYLSIFNSDTVAATVTVKLDANGTEYVLCKAQIGPGELMEYQEGLGFRVMNTLGAQKNSNNEGAHATGSGINTVVLGSDQANANATPNTIADVTGLSFAVTAGKLYWFQFDIWYAAAATATGSRWSINGPSSPTVLQYRSEYSLTTTTTTRNAVLTAYDLPAACNATSAITTHNWAQIEGLIMPSGDGTVIARFASEVTVSAITAKAGSKVHYQQLT